MFMLSLIYQTRRKAQNHNQMTISEINNLRNKNGVYSATNEISGWYAISRDGINMITFSNGKIKFYTIKGFAKKLTDLLNRGF